MPAISLNDTSTYLALSLQVINIIISALFLIYFINRYLHLRRLSMTNKYKNFFPRLRIIFSIIYILISLTTLIFSLVVDLYHNWYSYFLIGGGGSCINSVVMFIQLLVLRQELIKEHPYTTFHVIFFVILAIFSTLRYIWLLLINDFDSDCLGNLILSALLMVLSIIQLAYWIVKKQSLPHIVELMEFQQDPLMNRSFKSDPLSQKIMEKSNQSPNFPYLIPFVSVQNGQLKIVLQVIPTKLRLKSIQFESMTNPLDRKITSMGVPLLQSQQGEKKSSSQVISSNSYSSEDLLKLYVICGRFPLKKQIEIDKLDLHTLQKEMQQFLEQLFSEKQYYQEDILKLFDIPELYIQSYMNICQHQCYLEGAKEIDKKLTIKLHQDKHALYCSVQLFKHLWVNNHYEFYFRTTCPSVNVTTYPIKRYSEFQELHICLKNIIKTLEKPLELPSLPKKHLFHWNQQEHIRKRKTALEKYLRKLTNDYTLMQIPQIRFKLLIFLSMDADLELAPNFQFNYYHHLDIMKGQTTKLFIKNEYVTFYQFLIFREGVQINKLTKRYSEFEELHNELQRWMKNIRIVYNFIQMPEKVYFKSEAYRHGKLRSYLQNVTEAREIGKVYTVNAFFNIYGDQAQSISDISAIDALSKSKKSYSSSFFNGFIQLQEKSQKNSSNLSKSSGKFSRVLNDLGNESLD